MRGNEILVSKRSNAKSSVGWNHESIRCEVTVPGVDDGIKHGFKKQAISHPLGHDNVHLLYGECDFLDFAADAPGRSRGQ